MRTLTYAESIGIMRRMKIYRESDTCYAAAVEKMNRRAIPGDEVLQSVAAIIEEVRSLGDEALCDYAARFDRVELTPNQLKVTEEELAAAQAEVPQDVKDAIAASLANIE